MPTRYSSGTRRTVSSMSKSANAGELRTPVRFVRLRREENVNGYPIETEEEVFSSPVYVKWVNAHGSEVYEARMQKLREPATLTARYSPLIDGTLTVYRAGDPTPYEIISVDNVENRNLWLEIKVSRKVAAR